MRTHLQKSVGNSLQTGLPANSHLSSGSNHDTSSPRKLGEAMFCVSFLVSMNLLI